MLGTLLVKIKSCVFPWTLRLLNFRRVVVRLVSAVVCVVSTVVRCGRLLLLKSFLRFVLVTFRGILVWVGRAVVGVMVVMVLVVGLCSGLVKWLMGVLSTGLLMFTLCRYLSSVSVAVVLSVMLPYAGLIATVVCQG